MANRKPPYSDPDAQASESDTHFHDAEPGVENSSPEDVTEISTVVGPSPLDLPTPMFTMGLGRRKDNRATLLEWIRTALVEGTDYGRLHIAGKDRCPLARAGQALQCQVPQHWSKPSLFKPGAEKICGMLGVTVHFPSLPAYERAALSGQPLNAIILHCELRDGQGRTVAEGLGARTLSQDHGDLNKALKMAGKSAHIDATLRLAGLSEVFTHDLEDGTAPEAGREITEPPVTVSRAQLKYLDQRLKALGLERERVLSWIKRATRGQCTTFEDLTPELYERLLPKLERWAKPGNGKSANGRNHTPGEPKPRK
jgi:hypothetical protein